MRAYLFPFLSVKTQSYVCFTNVYERICFLSFHFYEHASQLSEHKRAHCGTHAEINRTPLSCGGDECDDDSLSLLRQSYLQRCILVCVCVCVCVVCVCVCVCVCTCTSVCPDACIYNAEVLSMCNKHLMLGQTPVIYTHTYTHSHTFNTFTQAQYSVNSHEKHRQTQWMAHD